MKKTRKTSAAENTRFPALPAAAALMTPAVSKAWLEFMSESTSFVMDRLQQDMETQKAILACRTPTEVMQVQSEFLRTAMAQYTEQATRLFRVMSVATEETVETAQTGFSRDHDDVPV